VETACILAELGVDENFVASALLKDVLINSMMVEEQLRSLVSPDVADLVVKFGRLDYICQVSTCSHHGAIMTSKNSITCLCLLHSISFGFSSGFFFIYFSRSIHQEEKRGMVPTEAAICQ
jgi:hypothetical protein